MAIDLSSLRLTSNRDNLFSRGFWNTFLTKIGKIVSDYVSDNSYTPPYKIYAARITQEESSTPSVTVLENTLGNIVWTRSAADAVLGTASSAIFTVNKTFINWSGNPSDTRKINVNNPNITDDEILITGTGTDTIGFLYIEIRVYN